MARVHGRGAGAAGADAELQRARMMSRSRTFGMDDTPHGVDKSRDFDASTAAATPSPDIVFDFSDAAVASRAATAGSARSDMPSNTMINNQNQQGCVG